MRAAKPAVARPSMKRARLSAARTSLISSADAHCRSRFASGILGGLPTIEHAVAVTWQALSGARLVFVVRMIKNKDVTGRVPVTIIPIARLVRRFRRPHHFGGFVSRRNARNARFIGVSRVLTGLDRGPRVS